MFNFLLPPPEWDPYNRKHWWESFWTAIAILGMAAIGLLVLLTELISGESLVLSAFKGIVFMIPGLIVMTVLIVAIRLMIDLLIFIRRWIN